MPRPLGDVGTDCVKEAERSAIQQKVFERAAAAMGKLPGGNQLKLPKLVEDWSWPRPVMGMAYTEINEIRLNMRLLCPPDEYEQTLAHEVAHQAQAQWIRWTKDHDEHRYGRRREGPHGDVWKAIMQHMGYRAEVKGRADMSSAYPEKYAGMSCACGRKHSLSRRKLKNVAGRGGWLVCTCGKRVEASEFKGAAMSRKVTKRACTRLRRAYYKNVAACERFWATKRGNKRSCAAAHKTGDAWFRLCATRDRKRRGR